MVQRGGPPVIRRRDPELLQGQSDYHDTAAGGGCWDYHAVEFSNGDDYEEGWRGDCGGVYLCYQAG